MEEKKVEKQATTLPALLQTSAVKNRFNEILGGTASSFISSILTIYRDNATLRKCDPTSILTAAGQAANLRLPIIPQLGYAYVIPYYDYKSGKYQAQFQIGYKGLIQLAMRSGLYRNLHSSEVYEGQIKDINPITGYVETGKRTSDKVTGYIAHMELVNGFTKTVYMSVAEVEKHAMTFSESYRNEKMRPYSPWTKNFNEMAKKTVMKKLLSTYAPVSIETQNSALATVAEEQPITLEQNAQEETVFETIDIADVGIESAAQ